MMMNLGDNDAFALWEWDHDTQQWLVSMYWSSGALVIADQNGNGQLDIPEEYLRYDSKSAYQIYMFEDVLDWSPCGTPSYEPNYWNDGDYVQNNNNCYNYSNNKQTDSFAQPGRTVGQECAYPEFPDCMTCDDIHANAVADGLEPIAAGVSCPYDKTKIFLAVNPYTDYHWWRHDDNGMWSHKMGYYPATNLDLSDNSISDPETADRGGYTDICGNFCVSSDITQGWGHEAIY